MIFVHWYVYETGVYFNQQTLKWLWHGSDKLYLKKIWPFSFATVGDFIFF